MALTENRLRQIIREEARKMMETERTPRGLPTRRGEPRDQDPNRDLAYGRGDRGSRAADLKQRSGGGYDEEEPRHNPNLNPERWWDDYNPWEDDDI